MDLILSSRPEDRRFVFEEASGITNTNLRRKRLCEARTDRAEPLRINDIILEVNAR